MTLPYEAGHGRHIYHQFVIRCERRDELQRSSRRAAASAARSTIRWLCTCRSASATWATGRGDLPVAEAEVVEVLALPIYPELEPVHQETVVEAVRAFYAA